MLLCLVTWLWYVNPYLLHVFPAMLFITSGKRIGIMIFRYYVISIYDIITSLGMNLGLHLYAALPSFPYLRCYLLEFLVIKLSLWGKVEGILSPTLSLLLSSSG